MPWLKKSLIQYFSIVLLDLHFVSQLIFYSPPNKLIEYQIIKHN